eukprot:scaffold138179_cov21-Tisochrysis_lutea.AAC.2
MLGLGLASQGKLNFCALQQQGCTRPSGSALKQCMHPSPKLHPSRQQVIVLAVRSQVLQEPQAGQHGALSGVDLGLF